MAARLANQFSNHILAMPIAFNQPLVCLRLFYRVEIFPLNILNQRDFRPRFLVELADNRRNFVQSGYLRRSPASLSGDLPSPVAFFMPPPPSAAAAVQLSPGQVGYRPPSRGI